MGSHVQTASVLIGKVFYGKFKRSTPQNRIASFAKLNLTRFVFSCCFHTEVVARLMNQNSAMSAKKFWENVWSNTFVFVIDVPAGAPVRAGLYCLQIHPSLCDETSYFATIN